MGALIFKPLPSDPGGMNISRVCRARVNRCALRVRWCSTSESSLAVMAASGIIEQIKPRMGPSERTFIGRGQFYPEPDMDRFGIVSLGADHTVEALLDGPLPAVDGMEAMSAAIEKASGTAPYLGELDFNATHAWKHGYYFKPSFGIFSHEGVVCTVDANGVGLPNDERAIVPVSDVAGVAVLLSECWTECHLAINLHQGDQINLCTLDLSSFNEQGDDNENTEQESASVLEMQSLATVVWETDWAIKCSAQLTMALRNHGATDAKLGIAEKLHAKHNEFAQMRNDLLLAGAQS